MLNIKTLVEENRKTTLEPELQKEIYALNCITKPNLLSQIECLEIINDIESHDKILKQGLDRNNERVDYRNSEVYFIDLESSNNLYRKIINEIININDKFLNFDITHLDRLQYSKYNTSQFLDYHDDDYFKYYYKHNQLLQRKLSISILLSGSSEYEGGEFILKTDNIKNNEYVWEANIGDAILFPSFLPHKVNKVTKGIRRSLVCWFFGPSWR